MFYFASFTSCATKKKNPLNFPDIEKSWKLEFSFFE